MDMHTLHVEHAVLLGLYTFMTLVNSWLHPGQKGVNWFPIYNLCGLAGAVLISLRGHIPDPVSIGLGDLFFPLAYLVLHRSLTEFFGKGSAQWQLQATLVAMASVVIFGYGVLKPDTAHRLMYYSFILSFQVALTALVVFRNSIGPLRISGGLMGLVLACLSFNNFFRSIGIMLHGAPVNYLSGGTLLAWALVATSVMQGGVTVAFVIMTSVVLRHDLHVQANTDSLTGLLNRRAVEVAAERAIAESLQKSRPLSAILIDLDGFKQINDCHGHLCGDATLIAAARCLQQGMRKDDLLARLGGDEFVVLLPGTPLTAAIEIAERLRVSLQQLEVAYGPLQTKVSASFGLTELQESAQNWDHLMLICDKALYSVKGAGGNLVAAH